MNNPGRFVAVRFVVRWGSLLPWLGALLCLAAGATAGWWTQALPATFTALAAVLVFGLTRLAVEVVDLVAETLLPR